MRGLAVRIEQFLEHIYNTVRAPEDDGGDTETMAKSDPDVAGRHDANEPSEPAIQSSRQRIKEKQKCVKLIK